MAVDTRIDITVTRLQVALLGPGSRYSARRPTLAGAPAGFVRVPAGQKVSTECCSERGRQVGEQRQFLDERTDRPWWIAAEKWIDSS